MKPHLKNYPTRKSYNKAYKLWLRSSPEGREKIRAASRANWAHEKTTISRRWLNLKKRVRREHNRNLTLSITREQFIENLQKSCTYCGKFSYEEPAGTTWCDRIDNDKGYDIDNIVPCCPACNQIRGVHLTVPEMVTAMKAVNALRASLAKRKS